MTPGVRTRPAWLFFPAPTFNVTSRFGAGQTPGPAPGRPSPWNGTPRAAAVAADSPRWPNYFCESFKVPVTMSSETRMHVTVAFVLELPCVERIQVYQSDEVS